MIQSDDGMSVTQDTRPSRWPGFGAPAQATLNGTFPAYTRPELLCDLAVHVTGIVSALIAIPFLLTLGLAKGDWAVAVSLPLYAAGLMAMLVCSALYNMVGHPNAKEWLRRFDHAAIFIMIAGTYSPFTLSKIGGVWGIGIFTLVWVLAISGIVIAFLFPRKADRLIIGLCLAIGWSIVLSLQPLIDSVTDHVLILLSVGGVIYTVGVGFHLATKLPYHNAIWHLFVLVAAAIHFAAVMEAVVFDVTVVTDAAATAGSLASQTP